jgi:hypothetical protein
MFFSKIYLLTTTVFFVILLGAFPVQSGGPKEKFTKDEIKLIKSYGVDFLVKIKKLNIDPSHYVHAIKLTSVGLKKLVDAEYDDALYLFKKAYKKVKSPNLLFYIAMTYKGMGRYIQGREYFIEFSRLYRHWTLTKIRKRRIKTAQTEIGRLELKLISVKIVVDTKDAIIRINGKQYGRAPMRKAVWLFPGVIRIEVLKPKYMDKGVSVKLKAGARYVKRINLVSRRSLMEKNIILIEERERKKAVLLKSKMEFDGLNKKYMERKKVIDYMAWAAIATSAITLIAGTYYGLKSMDPSSSVEDAPRDTPWIDVKNDYDNAQSAQSTSRTLLVTAGIMGSLGLIFYYYSTSIKKPSLNKIIDMEASDNTLTLAPNFSFDSVGLSFNYKF